MPSLVTRCHATVASGKRCKHRTRQLYFCVQHAYPTKLVLTKQEEILYACQFNALSDRKKVEYLEGISVPKGVVVQFLSTLIHDEDATLWPDLSEEAKEFFRRAALLGIRSGNDSLVTWVYAAEEKEHLSSIDVQKELFDPIFDFLRKLLLHPLCQLRCSHRRPRVLTPPPSPNLREMLEPDLDDCDTSTTCSPREYETVD